MTSPPPPDRDPRDAFFDVSGLTSGLGRQTGRSATAVLVFSVLRLGLMLLVTALLARLVPPAEQGLVALAMPAVLIATGLSEFGLAQAVIQRAHVTHRIASALFWVNAALGLALTLGVALLAPAAARFYETPEVLPILLVLAPYVLFSALAVPFVAILHRKLQVRSAEMCNFAGVVTGAVTSVAAAALGAGPWALVIQLLASQGSSLLYLVLKVKWLPSAPGRAALGEASGALAFGGYLSAERLVNELVGNLQTVIIGRAFGSVDAGLFFRSQTLAQIPRRRIVTPLAGAFIPSLSRLQTDPDGFREMYVRQVSRGNLIIVPAGLVMCLAPEALVLILLGRDWLGAVPLMAWLGLMPLTAMFASCNTWVLVACGKSRVLFLARLVASALLVVTLVVAARFGLVALVAGFALVQAAVVFPFLAAVAIRHTPIDGAAIRRAVGADIVFCILLFGLGTGLRAALPYDVLTEALLMIALIGLAQGVRILITPAYRRDVRAVLRR